MPPSPGIAFEVEMSDIAMSPPASVPKRVRRRLLETPEGRCRSPSSLPEIQAKLKEAESRRRQFHEWLASKARPIIKKFSHSLQNEELAERLQTKLAAAEQKRLELISQEQTRLARLEELRAAARTEVQLRAEREREELESRVESRVQQAATNRLALLEAEKQRRALAHEKVAQTSLIRTTLEGKDRERVEALRALICKRIAAADEKRENLLRAEKFRAQAAVLQARRVAKAVRRKRELELRNKKELLEARLQRAKRLRAEYLGQRGGCHKMKKYGERLCRKLTRCWRQFRRSRRTTLMLAQDFAACNVSRQSILSLPFEELAGRITSPTTLRSVKALLARIESRFMLSSASHPNISKIDHLLNRIFPPNKRGPSRNGHGTMRTSVNGSIDSPRGRNLSGRKATFCQRPVMKERERYPARVFLCAYMIIGHPEAVFSSRGDHESTLSEAASKLLPEFEKLITIILDGPPSTYVTEPSSPSFGDQSKALDADGSGNKPFSAQLAEFDAAWCSYLYHFVAWKVQDAHVLEEDLIRVAYQLELSMIQKCDGADVTHDNQAIQKQVLEDQKLLRERILHLTGTEGVSRLERALFEARNQCSEARKNGHPLPSPFGSPQKAKSPVQSPRAFPDRSSLDPKELLSPQETPAVAQAAKYLDNEKLVNEMLHEPDYNFTDSKYCEKENSDGMGEMHAHIRRIMEDAFWDGVLEGLEKVPPDYKRIIGLMQELKQELTNLVPDGWKQELNESLDEQIFLQVLESSSQDYDYFRRLLDYALDIVLKLGAPARDDDAKTSHCSLVQELSQISSEMGEKSRKSFALALVKGLRFILEQVQIVKADISAARIQALIPVIQGSAGVEYLQRAFSKRFSVPAGSIDGSCNSQLPKTAQWLAEVELNVEESKKEIEDSRSAFRASIPGNNRTSAGFPLSTMRTGGGMAIVGVPATTTAEDTSRGVGEPCALKWHSYEARVQLGVLNIISRTQALTEDNVPETFHMNLHRLRKAQNEYQRLLILTTGLLLLRQNAVAEGMSGTKLDEFLKMGKDRLDDKLKNEMISLPKVGDILADISLSLNSAVATNSELMIRMLVRSLSPDDAVFKRVSSVIHSALKARILLGKGREGGALVNAALQRVGASCLEGAVVDLGSNLARLASVSCLIHGPWYTLLVSSNQHSMETTD
ncbi:hypothetical protein KP509_07G046100 [Ceratopteris richardii]|nr:hypothetical protein KP509_07G046100 [Ceratopteris richardii]